MWLKISSKRLVGLPHFAAKTKQIVCIHLIAGKLTANIAAEMVLQTAKRHLVTVLLLITSKI